MNLRKKLVSNVFYNFLDIFILSLLGYAYWIILGKFMLPAEYGVVSTIIGLFQLFIPLTTLGLVGSLPKFIPHYLSKKEFGKIRTSIIMSLKIGIIISMIVGLLFFIFANYIAVNVYSDPNFVKSLQYILPLIVFGTIMSISKGGLIGFQEFKKIFLGDLVGSTIKTILAFGILYISVSVLGGIIGFLSWLIITGLMCTYYLYKNTPKVPKTNINKRRFLSYGIYAAIYGMTTFLIFQGGLIFLGILDSMTSVGYFRVIVLFGTFVNLPSLIISTSFSPNISSMWAEKSYKKLSTLVQVSLKYILIGTIPMIAILLSFPEFLINIFFSQEYLPAAELFLPYLLGTLIFSLTYIMWQTLYYTNEAKSLVKILIFGAILNALLCFIFIPTLFAFGASIAFLISQTVVFLICSFKIVRKLKIRFRPLLTAMLPSVILFILIYLLKDFNMIITIPLVVIMCIAYIFMLLKMKIFDEDDIKFIDALPSFWLMTKIKKFVIDAIRKEL